MRYLGGQQRPVLPRADPSVHQISIRDAVSCLAEQHQVGLQVTPVMRGFNGESFPKFKEHADGFSYPAAAGRTFR